MSKIFVSTIMLICLLLALPIAFAQMQEQKIFVVNLIYNKGDIIFEQYPYITNGFVTQLILEEVEEVETTNQLMGILTGSEVRVQSTTAASGVWNWIVKNIYEPADKLIFGEAEEGEEEMPAPAEEPVVPMPTIVEKSAEALPSTPEIEKATEITPSEIQQEELTPLQKKALTEVYTIKIKSGNTELYSNNFKFGLLQINERVDTCLEKALCPDPPVEILEKQLISINLPFFDKAKEIIITDSSGKKLLVADVSAFTTSVPLSLDRLESAKPIAVQPLLPKEVSDKESLIPTRNILGQVIKSFDHTVTKSALVTLILLVFIVIFLILSRRKK